MVGEIKWVGTAVVAVVLMIVGATNVSATDVYGCQAAYMARTQWSTTEIVSLCK